MTQARNVNIQEENELQKIIEQIKRYYYLFIIGVIVALVVAFLVNTFSVPVFKTTSTILIKDSKQQQDLGGFINQNLFGSNQNLQNELLTLQSAPIIMQTVKNLDLPVTYFKKEGFQYIDIYKATPFKILYRQNHFQPIGVKFKLVYESGGNIELSAYGEKVKLYHFEKNASRSTQENWKFGKRAKFGNLIENSDLSFIVELDSIYKDLLSESNIWYFEFKDVPALVEELKSKLEFNIANIDATAIEINYKCNSEEKGRDVVNSITSVYSRNNLEKKNHLASITIEYIDKQLTEISDSLSKTEQTLQKFKSSKQLLNVSEQSTGMAVQYREFDNKRAELLTNKKYYEYVLDYLHKNEDFSKIIAPASLGIQDQLLNNLVGELIAAQTQKSNLIENNQGKNPLIKKLSIQIENLKKTIAENISYGLKTTEISIDDISNRINKLEAEISLIPKTERQLTGIERKFRLDDAVYNYLMEKRAEANITRASNMPDNEIIEPAKTVGTGPVAPNKRMNYIIAFILGLALPLGYLQIRSTFSNRIEHQEQIEKITDVPVIGKILHNNKSTSNVVFEYSNSSIAESYRALRTNLDYFVRGSLKKVIMMTSCTEGEGKSFNALNLAMCYAQFNRKTILVDYDLRKRNTYFNKSGESLVGLSSYLINKAVIEDIIIHSPHQMLDYIPSGPIPPNPVELIGLENTSKLFELLKERYDYIIIDTSPLAQVTDAFLLMEQVDVKVIVTRYNYTIKKVFSFIMKDFKQKNIGNTCILLNDNQYFKDQYGYGYGYNSVKNERRS